MNRFFSGSEITRLDKLNRPNKKYVATMASMKDGKSAGLPTASS